MEKITELKFQKFETCEMDNVKGGAIAKSENVCGWDKDKMTNGGVAKSKMDGDWFYHKDNWTDCSPINFE